MWLNHNLDEVFQFWMGFGIASAILTGIEYKCGLKKFISFIGYVLKALCKIANGRLVLAKKRHKRYKHAKQVIRREIN